MQERLCSRDDIPSVFSDFTQSPSTFALYETTAGVGTSQYRDMIKPICNFAIDPVHAVSTFAYATKTIWYIDTTWGRQQSLWSYPSLLFADFKQHRWGQLLVNIVPTKVIVHFFPSILTIDLFIFWHNPFYNPFYMVTTTRGLVRAGWIWIRTKHFGATSFTFEHLR